jgi:hypothetical protein
MIYNNLPFKKTHQWELSISYFEILKANLFVELNGNLAREPSSNF